MAVADFGVLRTGHRSAIFYSVRSISGKREFSGKGLVVRHTEPYVTQPHNNKYFYENYCKLT
jgi:hypothetical protein